MNQKLKNKIKQIIYSTGGFPGQNKKQYIKSITEILMCNLNKNEVDALKKSNFEDTILEITEEICETIL